MAFIHPFNLIPVGHIAFPNLRWLQDRTVLTELPIIHSLINLLSGGFMSFAKCKFLKWFTRSLNVYDPHQGIVLPSFHPISKRLWMEFMLVWMRGILTSHILISQKRIQGDTSHILWSRCASVWNIFLIPIFLELLWSWLSLFW